VFSISGWSMNGSIGHSKASHGDAVDPSESNYSDWDTLEYWDESDGEDRAELESMSVSTSFHSALDSLGSPLQEPSGSPNSA
jgi:hypothetical protein